MDNPVKVLREAPVDRQAAAVRALKEVSSAMVSSLQLGHLLQRLMEITVKVLDASGGTLILLDPESQQLSAKVVLGPELQTMPETCELSAGQGIASWVFSNRTPVIVDCMGKDDRFSPQVDAFFGDPNKPLVAAPLLTQQDCLGVIGVTGKTSQRKFDELDLDILTSLAGQASFAIDNTLLSGNLSKQRERLLTIEREIHKKLARDLHDGPAQWLAGMSMNLEFVLRLLEGDPCRARSELEGMRAVLDKTIRQIRNLMFELRPVILETDGIRATIEQYATNLRQTDGMNVRLDLQFNETGLSMESQRCIFDIVREALSNIRRHAHTLEAWISMKADQNTLVVVVKDNGLGFDFGAVQRDYSSRGSLGMLNMMERAAFVNGSLSIESVPGYGTAVRLVVPLDRG